MISSILTVWFTYGLSGVLWLYDHGPHGPRARKRRSKENNADEGKWAGYFGSSWARAGFAMSVFVIAMSAAIMVLGMYAAISSIADNVRAAASALCDAADGDFDLLAVQEQAVWIAVLVRRAELGVTRSAVCFGPPLVRDSLGCCVSAPGTGIVFSLNTSRIVFPRAVDWYADFILQQWYAIDWTTGWHMSTVPAQPGISSEIPWKLW